MVQGFGSYLPIPYSYLHNAYSRYLLLVVPTYYFFFIEKYFSTGYVDVLR